MAKTCICLGDELSRYGFPDGHPFSPDRYSVYKQAVQDAGLVDKCCIHSPCVATIEQLKRFHTDAHIAKVQHYSDQGRGYLDAGDTPAFPGVFQAAATVVGTTLAAADSIMKENCRHAFSPIGGLHHARRDAASGFCVFNDCGAVIEHLFSVYKLKQVLYVDIDAHHGDGVFYSYERDERVIFLDFHQHSKTLYPGTGKASETGLGIAQGTKLNIEMLPGSSDEEFFAQWEKGREFIEQFAPEFVLFQCGVDSMHGDPITDLHYTHLVHEFVTEQLMRYSGLHCRGRLLALGGGGYNLENVAKGWSSVTRAMAEA